MFINRLTDIIRILVWRTQWVILACWIHKPAGFILANFMYFLSSLNLSSWSEYCEMADGDVSSDGRRFRCVSGDYNLGAELIAVNFSVGGMVPTGRPTGKQVQSSPGIEWHAPEMRKGEIRRYLIERRIPGCTDSIRRMRFGRGSLMRVHYNYRTVAIKI